MAGGLSYLNVTNGLFMIAIIVFAGLLGLLLSMMMRRQQTREQAHERMLERERQEHHAQTLDYATRTRYPLIGCVDCGTLFEKSLPARDSMEGSRCTTMDSWKTSTPII